MKKNRFGRILTAVLCAGMLAAQPFLSLTAMAGEQLGETDFDDGKGLPWHIVESATAEMDFEIEDGVYRITIVNPGGASNGGEDRWDCQFRHRGLSIVAGHQYHVHYEIKASNSGRYYTKIGNLAGNVEIWHNMSNGYDLDSHWDPIQINANEWKVVDLTFTAGQSMEVAEWAFHLGGDGQYTAGGCFPAGTVIEFDNMSLEDLTSSENDYVEEPAYERPGILVNQLGYFTGQRKQATLLSSAGSPVDYEILDSNGAAVYEGHSIPFGLDADSQDEVHVLDFSDFDGKGVFTIESADGSRSDSFSIGDSATYSALLYDSLNYFYQNRSGIAIESLFITSGDAAALARAAGHPNDVATVSQRWGYSGSSGSQDVTGGWYDAGDHGKYVVNGGISLWLLQNQYEMALATGMEGAYADGTMSIPENNNSCPDLLDEARWEMEWMIKMLVQDGEYRDMVYHKIHDAKWTGLGLAPADDTQERILLPPTTAATLNVAACAAQAARLWKGIDDGFAEECLDIAERTYAAAEAHPAMYAPMENEEGGGPYGDDDVSDEFYWAACELYLTTGEDDYLDAMKDSPYYMTVSSVLSGGESVDTYGAFDWGHVSALGTMSALLHKEEIGGSAWEQAREALRETADEFVAKENRQGYGVPYAPSTLSATNDRKGYIWGSNSFVVDNGIVIAYAYMLEQDAKYLNGAISALDYILGRNAMGTSYVTGYGSHTTQYPHHRYWAWQVDNAFPKAPNGVMVGGPNCGLEDPWVRGMGWKPGEIPPAKSYLDNIEAYSTNECTINWNAPLAWLTGFIAGNTDDGILLREVVLGAASAPQGRTEDVAGQTETAAAGSSIRSNTVTETDSTESVQSEAASSSRNREASAEKTEDSGMTRIIAIGMIIFGVLVALISVEVFIYKVIKLKRNDEIKEKEK